ncbi:Flavodoxin [Alteracholeplasma palmae J233]|uniref:Flavodoxin n=1 Tax=Alteracholeplasma palmae (strain ATCC 49389 / J233) TaxID=1318466 RepID=U4KLL7_ALTPJ|nr:flavodoxin [Alteracholeplasma palmae]CCV64767.1 Flavodoxin [Alteracholeplasma palmae J233]
MSILVVYWTGTGNTEIMAQQIYEGILSTGSEAVLKSVDQITPEKALEYDKIAFGCPSMGIENLEEDEFEPFFQDVEAHLANKKIALFGSYGWGDGEWMDAWEERVLDQNLDLFEKGLKINSTPSTDELETCFEFGARFASI